MLVDINNYTRISTDKMCFTGVWVQRILNSIAKYTTMKYKEKL